MRPFLLLATLVVTALTSVTTVTGFTAAPADPLRVFIRSGPKTHGPGAHDYPRFLEEWVSLLNERGAGGRADAFPTRRRPTDSSLHRGDAGDITDPQGDDYLARRGLVVIRGGVASTRRTGSRASSVARGDTTRPGGSKARCSSTSPIVMARSRRTCQLGHGRRDLHDMAILPEARILAGAYTKLWCAPVHSGARTHRGRHAREHLRHHHRCGPPRAHRWRPRYRVSVRSRAICRNLPTTARFFCAASRGRESARPPMSFSRRTSLAMPFATPRVGRPILPKPPRRSRSTRTST
jgi:hypothetical protein